MMDAIICKRTARQASKMDLVRFFLVYQRELWAEKLVFWILSEARNEKLWTASANKTEKMEQKMTTATVPNHQQSRKRTQVSLID
jgi:hypothetical protein